MSRRAATIAEISLGICLILGIQLRWTALGSAVLLAMFATAMTVSLGVKSPLDYSGILRIRRCTPAFAAGPRDDVYFVANAL